MSRANLSNVVLFLKASGVENVFSFDYLDAPPRSSLSSALQELHLLKALDDNGHVTEHGRKMSLFPIEPRLAKVILAAGDLGCTEEAITIASLLSVENLFAFGKKINQERVLDDEDEHEDDHRSFVSKSIRDFYDPMGDHLTLLKFYKAYTDSAPNQHTWLKGRSFVNRKSLAQALKIRSQLLSFCKIAKIQISSCLSDTERVAEAFLCGYSMNIAVLLPDRTYRTLSSNQVGHD